MESENSSKLPMPAFLQLACHKSHRFNQHFGLLLRGMSEEDLETLFDIDFGSGSRVRARFGLAACRSVVHAHGGDIVVQSRLGEGTVVRIHLPIQVDEPEASGGSDLSLP